MKLFGEGRDAMFDKVCGTDGIRKRFEENRPIEEIISFWESDTDDFKKLRAEYLLYD
jgi:uncharacterized protein YbbC (DUF1343 family)